MQAGTGAERQTAKEPVKNIGSNFMKAKSGLLEFLLMKTILFDSIEMKANNILILCYQNFEYMTTWIQPLSTTLVPERFRGGLILQTLPGAMI